MLKKKAFAAVFAVLMAMSAGASLNAPVKAIENEATVSASVQNYINEVASLVNQERTARGLSALQVVPALNQAAEIRAQEIVTQFSHTRPDGRSCSTVLDDYQISWRTTGENIAYGYDSPASVMNGWMNSSGHRANILNAEYDAVGIGVVSKNGVLYWTQIFTGGAEFQKTETPSGSAPVIPETTDTYTVPDTGTDCPVTVCTGDNCTQLKNIQDLLPGLNCNDGTCIINGQTCNTNDVLSALTQNCSGGNCIINGQTCNTNDVLSALTKNCSSGNCTPFSFLK